MAACVRPGSADNNEQGDYTVTELFLEVSLPLLADVPGARELTVDLAARFLTTIRLVRPPRGEARSFMRR